MSDFAIKKGLLESYTGPGGDLIIPEGREGGLRSTSIL